MRSTGKNPPIQVLWWLPERLKADQIAKFRAALDQGPLRRKVAHSAIPWAEPHWAPGPDHDQAPLTHDTIAEADLGCWADTVCALELDAEIGQGWRLDAVDTSSGGCVIALTVSHALTDGRGVIAAATLAARNIRSARPAPPSLFQDLCSAARSAWRNAGTRQSPSSPADIVPSPIATKTVLAPDDRARVAVTIARDEIERAARRYGGTVSGLLIAVTANLLQTARGASADPHPMKVAIPTSLRSTDDLTSSNLVGMAQISLDLGRGRVVDLADVRQRNKAAFAHHSAKSHLTGYPDADIAFSNTGEMTVECATAFGPVRGVLLRTVTAAPTPKGRINCFVLTQQDDVTVAFQGAAAPYHSGTVRDEFLRWSVDIRFEWW